MTKPEPPGIPHGYMQPPPSDPKPEQPRKPDPLPWVGTRKSNPTRKRKR